jgi:DNA-binding SARP family transcriptional activator
MRAQGSAMPTVRDVSRRCNRWTPSAHHGAIRPPAFLRRSRRAEFDVEVLGDIRVLRRGRPVAIGGALPRRLLAALMVDAPRAVPTSTLIERLWGDGPPATAKTALQVHVNRLRRVVEPDHRDGQPWRVVVTVAGGYALDVQRRHVDSFRFEDLVGEADRVAADDVLAALRRLDAARELWKGDPWGDLADEPWLGADAARLEAVRRRSQELWGELQLRVGRHHLVVDDLRGAVAEEPLRERRWEQLMLALYRAGRQADALQAFQDARRVFVEELGIEPGPSLRELELAILCQDESLDASTGTPSTVHPRHNLPVTLTSLLGRGDDVRAIEKALETARLVTITGTGGCGKTRLALAVAEELRERRHDGAWFVELTASPTSELVAVQIASALGIHEADEHSGTVPLERVQSFLRRKELLLVLDNCEHATA